MKFETKAIHVGYKPDENIGSVIPPIFMTSTFVLDEPGVTRGGYDYTRANNPNFEILEQQLASLDDAKYATVFSSGLGALTALIFADLRPQDKVLAFDGVYGGTFRLFNQVFSHFGIEFITINPSKNDVEKSIIKYKPKWLFFETPTNPLLEIYDIEKYANLAKKYNVKSVVDNTFATPYFQKPFNFGVDVVWYSTTKYMGGHSDIIGGVVLTNDQDFKDQLNFSRKAVGLNPSPFDCWLTSRGVKTLAIRMEKHMENALKLAKYLESHSKVKKVLYPGLLSHPQHDLAKKQMKGFSGIISAEFNLDLEETKKLISSLKIFTLAESLGGIESLICHPATMTHASIPKEERERIGLSDSLIRISVGIENADDMIEDFNDVL